MSDKTTESIVQEEHAQLDYAHSMSDGDYLHIAQVLSAQHLNRPGFELTPRSWTVTIPPIRRYFSAGTPPG